MPYNYSFPLILQFLPSIPLSVCASDEINARQLGAKRIRERQYASIVITVL